MSKGRPQIFNTDQGSQFTSEAFTSMLLAQGVQVSMDGRGRCMDNVFVERLWRSIKYEEVYLKAYQNGTEARKGIGAYLAFYNQERPHQALGYRSPGQVFHAVSPQRCLLELPRALPSDEGLRDTPGRLSYFSLTAVLMMGSTTGVPTLEVRTIRTCGAGRGQPESGSATEITYIHHGSGFQLYLMAIDGLAQPCWLAAV